MIAALVATGAIGPGWAQGLERAAQADPDNAERGPDAARADDGRYVCAVSGASARWDTEDGEAPAITAETILEYTGAGEVAALSGYATAKSIILGEGVTMTGVDKDLASKVQGAGVLKFTEDLSNGLAFDITSGISKFEFTNARITNNPGAAKTFCVRGGDTLTLANAALSTGATDVSLDVSGGEVTLTGRNESYGTMWYGNGSTFVQTGGKVTCTATGSGTSGNMNGLLLGWSGQGTTRMTVSGGELLVENSSINFWTGCSKLEVKGSGRVKAKGVFVGNGSGQSVVLSGSGAFELGPIGWHHATLSLDGGTLRAYEDARVSVTAAEGVRLEAGTSSTLAAAEGKTLDVTAPLTGAGDLTIGAAGHAGTVKLTSAASTATGTFTVADGATLVVPATEEGTATTYTVAGGGRVKLVLTPAQLAALSDVTLGNKFAEGFGGSIACADAAGNELTNRTATLEDGVVKVSYTSQKTLTWNGADSTWVDEAGVATEPDGSCLLKLQDGDVVALSADVAPLAVSMPETGLVTLKGYRHLDVSAILVPAQATLRLDHPGSGEIGENVVRSSLAFSGAGKVELHCSGANAYVYGLPVASGNFADDFTGRLRVGRGQFRSDVAVKASVDIEVVDGGNLWVHGGTWNNHFYLSGGGWNANANNGYDTVPLRLSDKGSIGASATLEFLTVDGRKSGLGNYYSNEYSGREIAGRLVGTDGFRMTSGYFVLTLPNSQTADLRGTIDLEGGVIAFGKGQYSVESFRFGDEVRIGANATLKWHTRTNTDITGDETAKGKIDTAFTLDGGTLELVDGSYVFNKDVTVAADSTLALHFAKGRIFKSLKGGEGVTLTLTSDNTDSRNGRCYFTGGDFAGTLKCENADAASDTWLTPVGAALQDATVDIAAGSKFYLALQDDVTLAGLKGGTSVFGDGLGVRTLTLKGGAFAGTFKDVANGQPNAENPLALVVAGDVSLSGGLSHSGLTTVSSGTLTLTGDAATAAATTGRAVKLAVGGKILLDQEPTRTENYTIMTADAAAAAAGQASVVKAVPVGPDASGMWTVAADIDAEKMAVKIGETLVAFGEKGLDDVVKEKGETPVTLAADKVTPGLYYSIVCSPSIRFDRDVAETARVLATGRAPVQLTVPGPRVDPATGKAYTVQFYKVSASLTAN